MSRFIVYHAIASLKQPYVIETLHDEETYEIFEEQISQNGTKTTPHIIVRRDGQQVNLLTGDFVAEFDDKREARKRVSRLEQVQEVMES